MATAYCRTSSHYLAEKVLETQPYELLVQLLTKQLWESTYQIHGIHLARHAVQPELQKPTKALHMQHLHL
jgi:hypothetical protein